MQKLIFLISMTLSLLVISPSVSFCGSDYGPQLMKYDQMDLNEQEETSLSQTIIIACPAQIAVDCGDSSQGVYANLMAFLAAGGNIFDAACTIDSASFAFVEDIITSSDACSQFVSRTYTISNNCGSSATCTQVVELTDLSDPIIMCPADISIAADMDLCSATPVLGVATAMDGCGGDPVISDNAPLLFEVGTTIVTYTAVDACGNMATCDQTVIIFDAQDPELNCPATINLSCEEVIPTAYADYIEFMADGGSAFDNCDIDPLSFILVSEISDNVTCPETITRTYSIADTSGNVATCDQLIIIDDNTLPTFTLPPDISINCNDDINDLTITGDISNLDDNCTAEVDLAVNYSDALATGGCANEAIITRTFTVVDACGNVGMMDQMIFTVDTLDPNAVCKNITLYLDNSGGATVVADSLDGGSTDQCGLDLTFSVQPTSIGCNDVLGPVMAELTVTDACNNSSTCMAVITVLDTMPVQLTAPPTVMVECDTDIPAPYEDGALGYQDFVTDSGSFDDNCSEEPGNFEYLEALTDTMGICPLTITRYYTMSDIAGNVDTASHILISEDTTDPILTCPADITVADPNICSMFVTVPALGINENCGIASVVNDYNGTSDASDTYYGGTTVVTYTVTDLCGNTAQCSFSVILSADSPITCPSDTTVSCGIADAVPYADIDVFISAGGDVNGECMIDSSSFSYVGDSLIMDGACNKVYERTYQVSDDVGLVFTCTQMILQNDLESPVINTCSANINTNVDFMTCMATVVVPPLSDIMDNCGIASIVNDYNNSEDASDSYPLGTTTVTWTVMDSCGNMATCTFDINVGDPESPLLLCPADVTTMCSADDVPTYTTLLDFIGAGGMTSDNCSIDTLSFALTDESTSGNQVIRTYSIGDGNMNTASCMQTITIMDSTIPTIVCPADAMMDAAMGTCSADFVFQPPSIPGDNCGIFTVTNDYNGTDDASDNYPVGTTLVTYTVTDDSNNSAQCSFNVTVVDVEAPNFSCPPSDISISCDISEAPPFTLLEFIAAGGIANDPCGIDSLSFTSMDVSDGASCPETITRTYTITDSSGLISSCDQMIIINDLDPPVINTCTGNINSNVDFMSCMATVSVPALNDITEACGIQSIVNDYNGTADASDIYPLGTTTVTWTVTDNCDNTDQCSFDVIVSDTESPQMACPDTSFVSCDVSGALVFMDFEEFLAEGGSAADNCELDTLSFSFDGESSVMTDGIITITRTYSISDTALVPNMATCDHIIVVMDTLILTSPDNDTTECDSDLIPLFATFQEYLDGGGTGMDNCALDTMSFMFESEVSDGNVCPEIVTRTYSIMDLMGNTAMADHTIVVLDETNPTFTRPMDTIISCIEDPLDVLVTGDVTDEADNCPTTQLLEATFMDNVSPGGCANEMVIERTWSLSDTCGNTETQVQMITVIDTIPPSFDASPSVLDDINCYDPFPAPDMLTATDRCGPFADVVVDTLPYDVNICAGYDVTYRYTATDACGNSTAITQIFSVKPDLTPPSILSVMDVTMNNDLDSCNALVTVPLPEAFDSCSTVLFTNDYNGTDDASDIYPVGMTTITWTVADTCGNDTTVEQNITVFDVQAPDLSCKDDLVIAISDPGANEVPADTFVNYAIDNCGTIALIEAMRMVEGCDDPTSDEFGPTVPFCCDDVGNSVMIMVRVTDDIGNSNTCMIEVDVEDNLPPTLIAGLPDISISCEYPIDTSDLTEFGMIETDPDSLDHIIILDTFYNDVNGFAGVDGLVVDNCPDHITITESFRDSTEHGFGKIYRDFVITDLGGFTINFTQSICIIDVDPFSEDDITWPEDYVFEGCIYPLVDTTISGSPMYPVGEKCSLPATTYTDLVFDNPISGCAYVRRTFSVIDWATYIPNDPDNTGRFTYIQDIYVVNSVSPVFDAGVCVDTVICAPGIECEANVALSVSATDDCTDTEDLAYIYDIDYFNDGSPNESGSGNSINGVYPRGVHAITWTVEDRCGNETSCTQLFTVRDCKAPTPICINGLAISLGNNEGTVATIWASDFDNGSFDNCTDSGNLILSFSEDPNDFGRSYTCDSIGIRSVSLYVTDEDGNQSHCNTFVEVQDNFNICSGNITSGDPDGYVQIEGLVVTEENQAIPDTRIDISGGETSDYFMTDEEGNYAFNDLAMYNDYMLVPENDNGPMDGVSTLDLVLIHRHILGMQYLDSPYKVIAADINSSEHISAADLIELRKMILGIHEEFPNNTSWRFINGEVIFTNEESPWPFNEYIEYFGVDTDIMHSDFVGIKIGDVNGTVNDLLAGTTSSRNSDGILIYASDKELKKGDVTRIPFYVKDFNNIVGAQWTFDYDEEVLAFTDIKSGDTEWSKDQIAEINRRNNDYLTFAWSNLEGVSLDDGDILFTLEFSVKENTTLEEALSISSAVTNQVAFNTDLESLDLDFEVMKNENELFYELFQNTPNPFTSETSISFSVPERSEITITVMDQAGRKVYSYSGIFDQGEHTIKLSDKELRGSKGILYYRMEGAEYDQVMKMLKIE